MPPGTMHICGKCGATNAADFSFCVRCGKSLAPAPRPPTNPRWLTEMVFDLGLWLFVLAFNVGAGMFLAGLAALVFTAFSGEALLLIVLGGFIAWVSQRAIRSTAQAYRNAQPAGPPPPADNADDVTVASVASTGAWLVFGALTAGGIALMVTGLVLLVRDGRRDAIIVVGVGAIFAGLFAKMLKNTLAENRSAGETDADDHDLDDSWRIPGYGSDAEDADDGDR